MTRLLTPKPQKKHIDRSTSVMLAKYQKLCSNFQRIFPSNEVTSILRTVFLVENLIVDFWEDGGVLRLSCDRIQNHCHTAAQCLHQNALPSRQMWAISHLLDCIVTFLCDCSRRGGRSRPVTNAESRFLSVSGMRGSEWRLTDQGTYTEKTYWGGHGGSMPSRWSSGDGMWSSVVGGWKFAAEAGGVAGDASGCFGVSQ